MGADLKGVENEDRVEVALIFLHKLGLIFRYYRSKPFGDLDSLGGDFLVWETFSRVHFLQVKSSEEGKAYFQSKYGNGIPCLVVDPNQTTQELARRILKELGIETVTYDSLIKELCVA